MQDNLNHPSQSKQNILPGKIRLNGIITGMLILVTLIPTVFAADLVKERQQRQEEVKSELRVKWAGSQTITLPYLFIPFGISVTEPNDKVNTEKNRFYYPLGEFKYIRRCFY